MIISKTPLRISLAGGGTDCRAFYERGVPGFVISASITPSVYVILQERFDRKLYVGYSKTEVVDSWHQVEHDLVRACLKKAGVARGIELKIMADVPSKGTGLGSSSALTVGLLNALYTYKGMVVTPEILAKDACDIEIGELGRPIGKQDQYIAAYGGMRGFDFNADGTVKVYTNVVDRRGRYQDLSNNLMLFYTGISRQTSDILEQQNSNENILDKYNDLISIERIAGQMYHAVMEGELEEVGLILDRSWQIKKTLSGGITNTAIDKMYGEALNAGALGGKICGAGGGGFLLLYCEQKNQEAVRNALWELRELPFNFSRYGSRIMLNEED